MIRFIHDQTPNNKIGITDWVPSKEFDSTDLGAIIDYLKLPGVRHITILVGNQKNNFSYQIDIPLVVTTRTRFSISQ